MTVRSEKRKGHAEIVEWLSETLSGVLNVPKNDLDLDKPLSAYGLQSRDAMILSGDLSRWLGRDVHPTVFWDYPTIRKLARHFAGHGENGDKAEKAGIDRAEPVAIVGMGCRFPGARNVREFWNLLVEGKEVITPWPEDRGKADFHGGFLEDIEGFDAAFFGISPREAEKMDPQQRILLEVTWEALEDAGIPPEKIEGSQTGVFMGISNGDFGREAMYDPERADLYTVTGNAFCMVANRISYLLDLRGPSIAVDTACSAALVAVHMACMSLWAGESHMAIAGGVNLLLFPEVSKIFMDSGMLAKDGRCKTFDMSADGYVRGEGIGVVVLKPLSKALEDGDDIYAVIRGSAVNQDGRSNGLTAPNRHAQEAVLREAYRRAEIPPGQVQYVEAHGTGTALGDPVEVAALGNVLSEGRDPGKVCRIGSVKTNIGHLESAAGVASLIKVALALKHGWIPASLNVDRENALIPFDAMCLQVQTEGGPWPEEEGRRIAGISSFGLGGTNAHVVLEAAPERIGPADDRPEASPKWHLLPISAKDPKALADLARSYRDALRRGMDDYRMDEISFTAQARRTHHRYRLVLLGRDRKQWIRALNDWLKRKPSDRWMEGAADPRRRRRVAFIFSGQGSQWAGMGKNLYKRERVFRETVDECDRLFRELAGWSVLKECWKTPKKSKLDETRIAQPAIFTIQAGLIHLWKSWGIEPDAVVGHSLGEVAAAYAAGIYSLEEAVQIVWHRSRLMQSVEGRGAMAAVGLTEEQAARQIRAYGNRLSIAAVNGPASVVLSGDAEVLEEVLAGLERDGVRVTRLPIRYAFHSSHMDPILEELDANVQLILPKPPTISMISTSLGREIRDGDLFDGYWMKNVRGTVRFHEAIRLLAREHGIDTWMEVGPHPVLIRDIHEILDEAGTSGEILYSLHRRKQGPDSLCTSLARLYAAGHDIDWTGLHDGRRRPVKMPTYPWQHQRFPAAVRAPRHVWKAGMIRLARGSDQTVWEFPVNSGWDPDSVLRDALGSLDPGEVFRVTGAMRLNERKIGNPGIVQMVLEPLDDRIRHLTLYARETDGGWTLCFAAYLEKSAADVSQEEAAPQPEDRENGNRMDWTGGKDEWVAYLRREIGRTLKMDPNRLDLHVPVTMLGLDSLMIVEIRNRIGRDLGIQPDLALFVQGLSIMELAVELTKEWEKKKESQAVSV